MKTLFKYRNLVFMPLALYVLSVRESGGSYVDLNTSAYFILFVILSLVVLGMEILAYFKWSDLDTAFKYSEVITSVVFSFLAAGFFLYLIIKNGTYLYLVLIGNVYVAQGIVWTMIMVKRKRFQLQRLTEADKKINL